MPTAQVVTDTLFVPGAVGVGGSPATSVETTDQSHGCESITARGGCCRTPLAAGASADALDAPSAQPGTAYLFSGWPGGWCMSLAAISFIRG